MEAAETRSAVGLNDFGDWLSPMLVKELRQGMRTRTFVGSFIALQGFLIFNALTAILAALEGGSTEFASGFFWFLITVPALLVLPLAGLHALDGERGTNGLDLIFLTRVTAWRLISNKWVSLMAQLGLMAVSVLPYMALRYFLGGVNLVEEFGALVLILVGSAVSCALTVGVSPFQNRITRVLFLVGAIMVFPMLAVLVISMVMMGTRRFGVPGDVIGVFLVLAPPVVFGLLRFGAARIAPAAENHAVAKRLVGIAAVLVVLAALALGMKPDALLAVGALVVALVCCDALAEPVQPVAGTFFGFARTGWLGGILRHFLAPGWVSGMWYAALCAGLMLALYYVGDRPAGRSATGFYLAVILLGAVFAGPGLLRVIYPKKPSIWGHIVGVTFLSWGVVVMIAAAGGRTRELLQSVVGLYPPVSFFQVAMDPGNVSELEFRATVATCFAAAVFALIFFRGRGLRKMSQALWDEAVAEMRQGVR